MKRLVLALATLTLCACPASPKVIDIKNGNEQNLSCEQLQSEITAATQAKTDAHAEDNFRFSNIFPPTGILSTFNISRAHDHSTARLELLNKISMDKGCTNVPYSSNSNYMVLAQYVPDERYVPQEQLETQEITPFIPEGNATTTNENNIATQSDESKALEEEDPSTKDQNSDEYLKGGYDSESFPRSDPKSAIRAVF